MPPFIGIDLGTVFTAVASTGPSGRPDVIVSATGRRRTPSVVAFGDSAPTVGRERRSPGSDYVVEWVKSMLGDPDRQISLPSQDLRSSPAYTRPEEVTALLFARVRADAERALGTS